MRELIYNFREQVWYSFDLDRLTMSSPSDPRPSIGIDRLGQLFYFDLRELAPALLAELEDDEELSADPRPFQPSAVPEPFSFFLDTNLFSAGNAAVQSLRTRNTVLSITYAKVPGTPAVNDEMSLSVLSYGRLDVDEAPVVDTHSNRIGKMSFPLRAGGKAMQFKISGENIQTFIRFGPIDVEADAGGKR